MELLVNKQYKRCLFEGSGHQPQFLLFLLGSLGLLRNNLGVMVMRLTARLMPFGLVEGNLKKLQDFQVFTDGPSYGHREETRRRGMKRLSKQIQLVIYLDTKLG